jgi:quercetin dioxygenase-like cupin family protein
VTQRHEEVSIMKVLICAVFAALTVAGASFAAGNPGGITAKVLADGKVAKPFTVQVDKPADIVVVSAKVAPGGSFGWHTHRSAVAVAVVSGTLTLYDSDRAGCAPQRISGGHGFVEHPDHVHLARNEGKKPVRLVVTYLGAPHGKSPDAPAQQPPGCPAA